MKDKDFQRTFIAAQKGDIKALEALIAMFMPGMIKNSFINGKFDSDCLQELIIRFIICVQNFELDIDIDTLIFQDLDINEY